MFESLSTISNCKMDFFKKLSLRFQNKGSTAAAPLQTKSPLALDSDISAIDGKRKIQFDYETQELNSK